MTSLKPYLSIPICECGESLVPLSNEIFALTCPHPYVLAGAPYGSDSPWMLRKSIAESLLLAQQSLQNMRHGWKIRLTDALRPNAVQAFLVDRECTLQAKALGFDPQNLSAAELQEVHAHVFRLWGIPSDNPATPPPHSTGAAFDCTLIDENGREIDMGCPVDENSDRSRPDYFGMASDDDGIKAHAHRVLLHDVLRAEGFIRHRNEWWHFSRGDQLAVWNEFGNNTQAHAIYGRANLI